MNRKNILICLFLCFFVLFAPSVFCDEPKTLSQPIVLSLGAENARQQPLVWRSAEDVASPTVQVVPWGPDPTFGKNAQVQRFSPVVTVEAGSPVFFYEVVLENLLPNTVYGYRVGDGANWSEWHSFRTSGEDSEPFKFIYLGDVQNDILSLGSRTIREAYAACPEARFIAFAGDLVAEGYDLSLWKEWTDALSFISAKVPCIAATGNHDSHQPETEIIAGPHPLFKAHFAFPKNGPDGVPELEEAAFFVDYQQVRLIVIDANVFANEDYLQEKRQEVESAQLKWLERVLQETSAPWTIVLQHQPVFSVGKDRDHAAMRSLLMPLYQRYGVDLVLQGHDHYYSRSHKIWDATKVEPDKPGVVYVTSVAGSKMYPRNPKFEHLMAVMRGNTQMYQTIEVSPDVIRFKAFAVGGELVDAFELLKNTSGETVLVSSVGQ